mmetsp:Transcript_35696/g.33838  ORF Transcript_35696/g.33838 Transcript_35696/m.33838 type:complete len:160 (+) Transcript_35696:20-499(+)
MMDIDELHKKDVKMVKLKICVYGLNVDVTRSHAFCIDDMPTGTSPQIGDIVVDSKSTTFKELRNKVQYNRSEDMDKRSLIFQEALSIMDRLPNTFNKPKEDLKKYLFGFVRRDNNELKIVLGDQEGMAIEIFLERYEFFARNLMLIPLSQLPLDFIGPF